MVFCRIIIIKSLKRKWNHSIRKTSSPHYTPSTSKMSSSYNRLRSWSRKFCKAINKLKKVWKPTGTNSRVARWPRIHFFTPKTMNGWRAQTWLPIRPCLTNKTRTWTLTISQKVQIWRVTTTSMRISRLSSQWSHLCRKIRHCVISIFRIWISRTSAHLILTALLRKARVSLSLKIGLKTSS